MNDELQNLKEQVKENITKLVTKGKLQEAQQLLNQYADMAKDDIEVFSIQAVIGIHTGKLAEAQNSIETGLKIEKSNFDLLYNSAYILELQQKYVEAASTYRQLITEIYPREQQAVARDALVRIKENCPEIDLNRKKIVFFAKPGMDNFLTNVIDGLSEEFETKKLIVTEGTQIIEGMSWADICWFEWCDELIIFASQLEISKNKKIVCRLHSYEAFTDWPQQVQWGNVDHLICDVSHIREVVLQKINIDLSKVILIPVSVNIEKFTFKNRRDGFKVAYVGYINYKKGPMLLIQFINALVKKDRRYKLFICGDFQDERDYLYFKQMIREMRLEKNIIHTGWIENVNGWLEDKDYIISTSLLEGQHLSVMEGMCKGIKPIIHNFVGAKQVYGEKYVWNTIDEGVEMVRESRYCSQEYRQFIIENYSNELQIRKIKQLFENQSFDKKDISMKDKPLVTVGIINYNYSKFLNQCVESVLNQSYSNIEIIIVDDCSKDDSIEKIKLYERQYKRIRGIYHKENSGNGVLGFQEIIREASGKYLMLLSADDYLDTRDILYDIVDELIKNSSLDYVYCNLKIVDLNGRCKDIWRYKQYSDDEIIHDTFQRGGSAVLAITAGVYKTEFYRANNLSWYDDKENRVAADALNSLIYLKNNLKYKYIDKELVCYRHHNENMTYDLKNRIKSIISVMEYLINNFSEEVYLMEINWHSFSGDNDRQEAKMYYVGMKYLSILNYYNNTSFKPWDGAKTEFSDNEIKLYVQPLVLKVKEYFSRSLSYGRKYYFEIESVKSALQ